MKLELSIAADGALVVRLPQPMSRPLPALSRAVIPYQGAGDAVEEQVLSVIAHGGGNVVQLGICEPGGKPARGPIRVGGGASGFASHVDIELGHLMSPM